MDCKEYLTDDCGDSTSRILNSNEASTKQEVVISLDLCRNDPSILACWNRCVKVKAAALSRVAGNTINLPVRLLSRGSQCLRLRLLFTLRRASEFFNKVSREDAARQTTALINTQAGNSDKSRRVSIFEQEILVNSEIIHPWPPGSGPRARQKGSFITLTTHPANLQRVQLWGFGFFFAD